MNEGPRLCPTGKVCVVRDDDPDACPFHAICAVIREKYGELHAPHDPKRKRRRRRGLADILAKG